jgi:hypothetical protein
VCITGDIGIESLKQGTCRFQSLDKLMNLPITQKPIVMKLPLPDKSAEEDLSVTTCREYLDYSTRGASIGYTTLATLAETQWTSTCLMLKLLKQGKRSEHSYIENVTLDDLNHMSSDILWSDDPNWQKPPPTSIAALVASGEVHVLVSEPRFIKLEYGYYTEWFREVARGDFNGDGWRDILISTYGGPTDGSHRASGLVAVSRTKATGLVVAVDFAPLAN